MTAFHHTGTLCKAAATPNNRLLSSLQSINRAFQRAFAPGRQKRNPKQKYKRAIIKGNFVRLKVVPPAPPPPAVVPKLPPAGPAVMPRPFENVPVAPTSSGAAAGSNAGTHHPNVDVAHKTVVEGTSSTAASGAASTLSNSQQQQDQRYSSFERWKAWLRQNAAVLILNFGSICTLVGFTRSDVLELRALSTTGSLCYVGFEVLNGLRNPRTGIRWPPVLWSTLFATVNAYNIYKIMDERKSRVKLEEHEEAIYVEHFMPHGLTPKQFQKAIRKAETRTIPKGSLLIEQGKQITSIYLVVNGRTKAQDMGGRRLTAASSTAGNRNHRQGGDSGAFIGEMAFLETFWAKEMKKQPEEQRKALLIGGAIYSVRAETDCEVLHWSFAAMEEIVLTSTDMRAAMTRAMTAAIVGKVVNFTVASQNRYGPPWSSWLKDWKYAGGGAVRVESLVENEQGSQSIVQAKEGDDADDDEAAPLLPPL